MKRFFLTLSLIFILGCGYKPASTYTKEFFDDEIFTKIKLLLSEPENSIVIKDAVNEAIAIRFQGKVTKNPEAKSRLFVEVDKIDFREIEYDKNGYITRYSIKVVLNIDYQSMNRNFKFKTEGFYEFKVEPASILTDFKRYEAIKEASLRAIDMFITKVLIAGYKK